MYYYAIIEDGSWICYEVIESDYPIDDPYYIQINDYDTSYITRKKYVNGEWVDTDPIETGCLQANLIGIGVEWLDNKIYEIEDGIANHTHTGYVSSNDLQVLEDVVDTKADINHTHNGYSEITHNHDSEYSSIGHSHTNYATTSALNELSSVVSDKANASHSHNDTYYTETEIDTKLATKADSSHNHSDVYANASHTHTASAVGAVATSDIATVSEVETYLGI